METTSTPGDVVAQLLGDSWTRQLSFTGSTAVGKALMAQTADNMLAKSLKLGGNAPLIVCRNADLDAAAHGDVQAKARSKGQTAVAVNRFYVHAEIARGSPVGSSSGSRRLGSVTGCRQASNSAR